jgi:hypothetical protein
MALSDMHQIAFSKMTLHFNVSDTFNTLRSGLVESSFSAASWFFMKLEIVLQQQLHDI